MRTYCAARSDHVKTWSPYGLRGLSVYCITNFFTAVSESTLRMTAGDACGKPLLQTRNARPYGFVQFSFVRWYAFITGRRGAVPYKICALFFHKSNIGERAGSRRPA